MDSKYLLIGVSIVLLFSGYILLYGGVGTDELNGGLETKIIITYEDGSVEVIEPNILTSFLNSLTLSRLTVVNVEGKAIDTIRVPVYATATYEGSSRTFDISGSSNAILLGQVIGSVSISTSKTMPSGMKTEVGSLTVTKANIAEVLVEGQTSTIIWSFDLSFFEASSGLTRTGSASATVDVSNIVPIDPNFEVTVTSSSATVSEDPWCPDPLYGC